MNHEGCHTCECEPDVNWTCEECQNCEPCDGCGNCQECEPDCVACTDCGTTVSGMAMDQCACEGDE